MAENLQGDEGFCMAEILQETGSWEPVTPAKPVPERLELESTSKAVDKEESLQSLDAALSSREGFEKFNVTVEELDDHEKRSGVNGRLFDTETSSNEENSRNHNGGAVMVERIDIGCMQQLLWGNANSQNESNGFQRTTNLSSEGKDGGITDSGTGNGGNGFGVNKPQNIRKRKRKSAATDLNRRQRVKVKKHRPKIFDEMKPKKIPKTQKKTKSEKKRNDKKKRKEVKKSSTLDSASSNITDPPTPEPSKTNRVSSSIGSCRSFSSFGKTFDSCSEHPVTSCKKALVYDQDGGQGLSPSQEFSDEIVLPRNRVYTRRRKNFRRMDFDLSLEVQDFESCAELRKIVSEVKTPKAQFKDFPVTGKKMRMGRRKAFAYPYFLEASKQDMLVTERQFSAAIMDPKCFRCVLALQPKVICRKKRSKRFKNLAAAMREAAGFNSYNHLLSSSWPLEYVNGIFPLSRKLQPDHALSISLTCGSRNRSQIDMRSALSLPNLCFGSDFKDIEVDKSPLIDLNEFPGVSEEALDVDIQNSLVDSVEVESQKPQIQEFLSYEDGFHRVQMAHVESYHLEHKGLINDLIKQLETLSISDICKQIVIRDGSSHGALVLSKRRAKKNKPPEVIPDEEMMKAWIPSKVANGCETTEEKYWEEQQKIFCERVYLFLEFMHFVQGDRRFSRWKGSVVDSVIGVFLTQNVTDNMSSDAFMRLAAKFPKYPVQSEDDIQDGGEGIEFSQESISSTIERDGPRTVEDSRQSCASEIQQSTNHNITEEVENAMPVFEGGTLDRDALSKGQVSKEVVDTKTGPNSGANSRRKKGKPEKTEEIPTHWDDLRKEYATMSRDTTGDTDDSVDWEAVRRTPVEEVAKIIAKRGMNNMLAKYIKKFLDEIVRDHGSIDLEWLRNVPPEKTKEFLLRFNRLGLKSLECVRLLTLNHHAFPVDTNVARIVVRLGWVPLQPLPDGVELHLLERYPMLDAIQKYLYPRLNALDQLKLYELHYHMITFGKVFCTKVKPRCDVCPMRQSCKHAASALSAKHPGQQDKEIVKAKAGYTTANPDHTRREAPLEVSLVDDNFLESGHGSQISEPIIEMPASPEPKFWETPEMDIEDLSWESKSKSEESPGEEIDELFWDLTNGPTSLGIASKALVALAPEASSLPAPKLKSLGRLRTVHVVYELPDDHDLLSQFRKREPVDPCPYLFAIWITDEQTDETVSGTILIPSRTANEGRFPLAGTYFQVNEVFADHETSVCPIRVSRSLLWNLRTRRLYCAATGRSIFADMTLLEIHHCFWNGFICERGFNRKTREPEDLHTRFHASKTKGVKPKAEKSRDDNDGKTKLKGTKKGKGSRKQ